MGLKDLNFQGVIFSKEFRNIGFFLAQPSSKTTFLLILKISKEKKSQNPKILRQKYIRR